MGVPDFSERDREHSLTEEEALFLRPKAWSAFCPQRLHLCILQLSHPILKSTTLRLCLMKMCIPHILQLSLLLRGMCLSEKPHTNHQTLLLVGRLDPLLRPSRGLALPQCWGLIAVLISLFLPNLFARSTDPTAMLNERVYQLKPVVRSTRGLIFSLRNESSPRTQVSRQLETPGASKRDYWHTQSWSASFLYCTLLTWC